MQYNENNPRRDFLKKIPLALGSIIFLSGFNLKKSYGLSQQKFKTLSKAETNEIIKNNNFRTLMQLEPAPVPNGQNNQI